MRRNIKEICEVFAKTSLLFLILTSPLLGDELRGFLIRGPEGKLFLADTPQIPSCCLTKPGKAIQLIGDFSHLSPYGVVTVQGRLLETSNGLKLVADGFTETDLLSEEIAPQ